MNSKEALNRLFDNLQCEGCHIECYLKGEEKEECYKWYEIIKKDLDRLEKLEKDIKELRKAIKTWNENGGKLLKENIELKKAIEILVNKRVNILILKYCIEKGEGIDTYNLYYTTEEQLTKEEYELLKEVLENEQ